MNNLHRQNYDYSREDRNKCYGHPSFVIWLTGLSGSGKSTIANALQVELINQNKKVYVLDGDNVRLGLNSDLGFTDIDRKENLRRIGEVAKLFVDAGVITICAFVSPLESDRRMLREIIGSNDYFEVYISTPIKICEERDVKGLYEKARKGEIANFTGITSAYETPETPNLVINTDSRTIEGCVEELLSSLNEKLS